MAGCTNSQPVSLKKWGEPSVCVLLGAATPLVPPPNALSIRGSSYRVVVVRFVPVVFHLLLVHSFLSSPQCVAVAHRT